MYGNSCAAVGEGVPIALFTILILDKNWTDRENNSRHYSGQLVGDSSGVVASFQT